MVCVCEEHKTCNNIVFPNIADEPTKEELNACVKKITKNIYALLEAQKSTQDK